ncbi:TonB-linked outer membrane protein, SusC/RagA family [Saccharicrinis carchari]|uniref:TonB-linked outer membrane protein, SusC/RagA family n=1 Tax=Saccharicrinis carchari TaxID=1168039 RepID=A0A521CDV0_SACCC|nr:TonB-linked outer membrane protein, SusC/RagA family [Saccharicrinis carchari]
MNVNCSAISKVITTVLLCLWLPGTILSNNSILDSQVVRITLDLENLSLGEVLSTIEKKSGYYFTYNRNQVNVDSKISVHAESKTIPELLNIIFNDKGINYEVKDENVVLYRVDQAKRTITGTITDKNGEPVVGATVMVKGTTTDGTITNFNGEFTLDVAEGETLVVSFIGFEQQEIIVGESSFYKIVLQDSTEQLGEVVVTAMGIERKAKSLTYATQSMDNEDLMRVQDASFINSLQGKAAGLKITPNVGGAGGASKILLRGNKSILGNNTPLIVVDGVPMSNPVKNQRGIGGGSEMGYGFSTEGADALSSINPDDIENINVLKGANAAALYGSAASNGVIMITTKKGKEGTLSVSVSSNVTFEDPMLLPELQDQYGAGINLNTDPAKISANSWGNKISSMTPEELEVEGLTNTPQDYIKDFFRTGSTYNTSVSLSGGTKNILSYFSYGNTTSNGMIENNNFTRNTIAFRQSYSLFKDILNVDVSINYVNQSTKNRPGGGTNQNPLYHLYTSPRNTDMNFYKNKYKIDDATWMSNSESSKHLVLVDPEKGLYKWVYEPVELSGTRQNWLFDAPDQNNPYWLINQNNRRDQEDRVYGYISTNVKLTEGLNAQARFSIDRSASSTTDERGATTQYPNSMMDRGVYGEWNRKSHEFYLDGMLNYDKTFGDYTVSASAGYSAHKITGNSRGIFENATAYDYSLMRVPTAINIFDPRAGAGSSRSFSKSINWDEGLFFTGQLGYKDFAFVEGSYRRDWYRAFTQFKDRDVADNYGYFSFGANVLMHEMISLPEFWNYLKVRASYSEVGNSIPNIMYASSNVNLVTGGVTPSPYAFFDNPIPEVSKSFETGFDVSFFRNALSWDVTYYNSTLNNSYLIVGSGGYSKPVNTGVIRNQGVETTLTYSLNLTKDLLWKTGVNFAYNSNKIEETYKEDGKEALIAQQIGFGGKFQIRYKQGGSYGDLYATDFKRNEDGSVVINGEGRPLLSSDKFGKFIGNMNSPYQLGWNNTFSYKNWSLYFLVDGKVGGKVVSFTEAYLDKLGLSTRSGADRLLADQNPELVFEDDEGDEHPAMRLPDGQLAPIQKYYEGIGGDINATQYVYDATNFRMKEVSLGYRFKDLFGKTKDLTLSAIGRNLFFLYNDAPIDPETSLSSQNSLGGFDIFNMPTARSYGMSVSVKF